MLMTILRVGLNKQMSHARATSTYTAWGPEFTLALVPTSQFKEPDRARPGSSPKGLFPPREDSPFLTSSRQEKDEGVLP